MELVYLDLRVDLQNEVLAGCYYSVVKNQQAPD
jgi:hypothetical protein